MAPTLEAGASTRQDGKGHKSVFAPSWRALFNFTIRRHTPTLVIALILTTISGIIVPALAILFGKIFNSFTDYGSGKIDGHVLTDYITTYAIAVVILGAATWISSGSCCMVWMAFGSLQAKSVRDQLFENLLHIEVQWYETHTSGIGALLPRLQTQIRDLQLATSQPIGFVAQSLVSTVASVGLAFYYSWKLTLVTLSTVPVAFFVLGVLTAVIQPQIEAQNVELKKAAEIAHTAISAIDVVKSCNSQEVEIRKYSTAVKSAALCYLKQARSNAVQLGFVRVFTLAMFVQGFWYGNHLAATEGLSFGTVTTAFWACLMATQAFENILPQMLVLEKGRAAGAALKAILNEVNKQPAALAPNGRKILKFCEGDIEVRAVSFAYPSRPEHLVLETSTFFFPVGETTFVVGRSGSGKSTIGNLIMRFYEPITGGIYIDGNDISQLDINWLRNNITLVQQESILFNETIFRNIAFGRRDHSAVQEQDIACCIEVAMLQSTLAQLPQGAATYVGATGSSLSGGQRQRVAIARARLRDTPVLILDESTSALDYISRTAVMDAIRSWRSGKTTIVITHDTSQISEDDFVYVLDEGKVAQEGFRHNLNMVAKGLFAGLVEKLPQSSGANLAEGDLSFPSDTHASHWETNGPGLMRRGSSYQRSTPSRKPQILESMITPPTSRRPSISLFTSPLASGSARRRSSVSSTTGIDEEGSFAFQAQRLFHRMSFQKGPDELNILRNMSVGPRGTRPMSAYGMPQPRAPHRFSIRQLDIRRLSSIKPDAVDFMQDGHDSASKHSKHHRLSIRRILFTIWPTLPPRHRIRLILGFVAASTNAAGPPIFAYIFSQLLETFFHPRQNQHKALIYSLAILGVAIVDGVGCYFMHYLLERCGQEWVDTLRIEAMKRILDQPKEWFDDQKIAPSKLDACLDRNADEMRNLLGRFAGLLFIAMLMIILAMSWSLIVCWKLTLVGIAAVPGLYGITRMFESVSSRWEGISNDADEVAGSILVETFSDIRTVRALTLEGYFHKKYNSATSTVLVVGLKRAVYCGFFLGAAESAIHFMTALVFWYGARIVAANEFSINHIMVVFSMILFSAANANAVLSFMPQITSSVETASRLLELVRLPVHASHEYSGTIRPPADADLTIRFNNMSFAYPSRRDVLALKNLTLDIPSRKCVAIVGQSGSGKSTIASLLLRFYSTPNSTNNAYPPLTISDYSITALSTPTIRSLISIVPQTPTVFPLTVAKNITYGLSPNSPHTSTSSIHSAASAAGIHDFIITLPQGYDTMIGEGGIGLSGGQAQRIVIARALVRKPRILILDEATSALDRESAGMVRETVRRLVRGGNIVPDAGRIGGLSMTVIVITHAKEMMMLGDEVVVLRQGECIEHGTFDELRRRKGGELAEILRAGGME